MSTHSAEQSSFQQGSLIFLGIPFIVSRGIYKIGRLRSSEDSYCFNLKCQLDAAW